MLAMSKRKLVAIGGGNGITHVIKACEAEFESRTAVVAVTDCGRSTGVARSIGNISAPGDIRNSIANLARDSDDVWVKLLQYRFKGEAVPQLNGMAAGNLILAALANIVPLQEAVTVLENLVGCTAKILPVSDANTDLCAELEDGTVRLNELETRGLDKARIKRLFLKDSGARALPEVVSAIQEADLVVIGPGSFYTSLQATLLFGGVREALRETSGKVVFVCNTTTQPGQTDGYSVKDHVVKMDQFLGDGVLEYVMINQTKELPAKLVEQYGGDGLQILQPNEEEIQAIKELGIETVVDDFAETQSEKRELWNKVDTLRHDSAKLVEHLVRIAR